MYVAVIQFHGKIDLFQSEPGLDNDTGGEIIYVLQACEAFAKHNHEVKILTRLLDENNQYRIKEQNRNGVQLVRLDMRSNNYRAKEELWPFIWDFTDSCLNYFIEENKYPNVIIGNYADGGTISSILCRILNIPFIFIPHSLGKIKLKNLLNGGQYYFDDLDRKYNFSKRIFHEEQLFNFANTVIVSSEHEKNYQCSMYKNYLPTKVRVVPPGINIQSINSCYDVKFKKKPILLVARLSRTKNLVPPIDILYRSEWLRANAEIIIASTNITWTDESKEIHMAIEERSQKYGDFVRFFQLDSQNDIFSLFQCAKEARGIYFNPSLIEPFGLTALEAASYGLPVVLTNNGGTVDIIKNVNIGFLVNVNDDNDIINKICSILNNSNSKTWQLFSDNGIRNINQYYSWDRWVKKIESVYSDEKQVGVPYLAFKSPEKNAMVIITELNGTLISTDASLTCSLKAFIENCRIDLYLIYLTDDSIEKALDIIKQWILPYPNIFICHSGAKIYSSDCSKTRYVVVEEWLKYINEGTMNFSNIENKTFVSQLPECQSQMKHFLYSDETLNVTSNIIDDHVDDRKLVPIQACKMLSIRWLLSCWSISLMRCIVCCDLRNFRDIVHGSIKFVILNNFDIPIESLEDIRFTYYSKEKFSAGVIEGIQFYLNNHF